MSRRKFNTVLRTIFLVVSIANQFVAALSGLLDIFPDERFYTIYSTVSVVMTAVASALSWWFNNSITPEAQQADEYLDALKAVRKKKADDNIESDCDFIDEGNGEDSESEEDNR